MLKDQDALIKLESDRYYILATSTYADDKTRVLNHGDTFAIFDRWGDIQQIGANVQGIYHQGTRFISNLIFRVNGYRPLLLSSNVTLNKELLTIDLSNPVLEMNGTKTDKGILHIARTKFMLDGFCYEKIIIHNYGVDKNQCECSFKFDGDFNDIFEVRGITREHRGQALPMELTDESTLKLAYRGLDDKIRTTWIRFETPIEWYADGSVTIPVELQAGEQTEIRYSLQFSVEDPESDHTKLKSSGSFEDAFEEFKKEQKESEYNIAQLTTSNEEFTNWMDLSKHDLLSLLASTRYGRYPYAGVPWYNTAFGRDGIITALQTLWMAPDMAKSVLLYLAANQAKELDGFRDAEPGKILHEARGGEMVELNEIPFKKYYGTIDATPLFVMLAGRYYKRTADKKSITKIWSNIVAAVEWIGTYGDIDGDGFVEYQQKMDSGLANQGWKDSHDSISHENGELAQTPIALCEVQGYVYEAYRQAAYLADALGETKNANTWRLKARDLKKKFNEAFWDKDLQTFVIALDGNKKPCRIKTSNAGQCLFTGIADASKAARVVKSLMQPDMFSGWGIRTLATTAKRYNPMSYHNGSVWPHDNALIAAGMARYGHNEEAMKVMGAMFNACLNSDFQTLPELFCGFQFNGREAPTAYPVACAPQAWSVAAVFYFLQSCLQMSIDATRKRIVFDSPQLPEYLKTVTIKNLFVPSGMFELEFIRYEWDIGIHVLAKPSDWRVVVHR